VGGNGGSTTFSGVLSGSGSLTKVGSGTMILTANNTYAGTTTVNAGTLVVGTGTNAGSIGTGNVVLGGGAIQFSRSDTVTLSQAISGSGTLRMESPGSTSTGSGVLVLADSNSYDGVTSLIRGTIRVAYSSALGSSALVGAGADQNKLLELSGGVTLTNAVTLAGGGLDNNGVLASVSGSNTLTNFNVAASSGTRLRVAAGSTLRITNNISDSSPSPKRILGGGTLVLEGDNSNAFTLSDATRFIVGLSGSGNGTIAVGNDLALGTAAVLFDASSTLRSASAAARSLANPIIFGSNAAQLTLGSADTGTLALSGTFTLQRSGTLAVANALTTISGPVEGTGFGITKTSAGTLLLTGSSSYTGPTAVNAGSLLVDGQLGATAMTVNSGGLLGGLGSLGGTLTFGNGSLLAFDQSASGLQLLAGDNVSFLSAASFGVASLRTRTGEAIDWSGIADGTYTLLANTTTDFGAKGIANFGSANAYDIGAGRSAYFQNGSLQLVIVPEPGAFVLAGLGIAAAAWAFRRRT
jgi:autotransporter-associated beta strand protein